MSERRRSSRESRKGPVVQQSGRARAVVSSMLTPQTYVGCSMLAAQLARELSARVTLMPLMDWSSARPGDSSRSSVAVGRADKKDAVFVLAPDQVLNVTFDDQRVDVEISKVDRVVGTQDGTAAAYELRIHASSERTLRRFILEGVERLQRSMEARGNSIRVFVGTRSGYWRPGGALPKRDPKTVVLDDDAMRTLMEVLRDFKSSESEYVEHGMPYKRVYCLYGPPGTGKTSAIFSICSHFGLSTAMLSGGLREEGFEEAVAQLVNGLPRKSAMLLEDIDGMLPSRKDKPAESDREAAILSTMLNVLDGNLRNHGMIVFMTTNHIEKLDPALVRPGRVDRMVRVGLATPRQAAELFALYFPGDAQGAQRFADLVRASQRGVAPAELNAMLFAYRKDSAALMAEATRRLSGERTRPEEQQRQQPGERPEHRQEQQEQQQQGARKERRGERPNEQRPRRRARVRDPLSPAELAAEELLAAEEP